MKTFKQFIAESYADNLAKSKQMKQDTPRNKMEMHFARHDLVVKRAQPIKDGHRFTVLRHFTNDDRSAVSVKASVDKAISTSPFSAKHSGYKDQSGKTEYAQNHIHTVDVKY